MNTIDKNLLPYFLIAFSLVIVSCEPFRDIALYQYPNTEWKTKEDSEVQICMHVSNNKEITSVVTYNNQTIECTNYCVSMWIYFKSLEDETKCFSIKYSYVIDDKYFECETRYDFPNVFENGKEGIEFVLYRL